MPVNMPNTPVFYQVAPNSGCRKRVAQEKLTLAGIGQCKLNGFGTLRGLQATLLNRQIPRPTLGCKSIFKP
jgi:hypothetical protein